MAKQNKNQFEKDEEIVDWIIMNCVRPWLKYGVKNSQKAVKAIAVLENLKKMLKLHGQ